MLGGKANAGEARTRLTRTTDHTEEKFIREGNIGSFFTSPSLLIVRFFHGPPFLFISTLSLGSRFQRLALSLIALVSHHTGPADNLGLD